MNIYIAADHRGFELKKIISEFITQKLHLHVVDVGASHIDPADDYPDYVKMLAEKMEKDNSALGIVICGSGVGVCVAANKYDHLRCGMGLNKKQVESARNDDNINVLALASDHIEVEVAKQIAQTFIETSFSNLERHMRRLAKINEYADRSRGTGSLS